jgi:DNA topoisomerase I
LKTLIVSEKNIAAKRIAQLLSAGGVESGKTGTIDVYKFKLNGDEAVSIGLKGHIMKVDFPEEYANWQEVEPIKLVDAQIVKIPAQKALVAALKKQAKEADEVIIATDFDREGELIGVDAVNEILKVRPEMKFKRARFSALTKGEIESAFSNLDSLYYSLAQAGETRQDIDLIWGATLTRFLSLAATRLGRQFLSVGRVQSPTLCLVVSRERERQAFVPETYWQLKGLFDFKDERFEAGHKTERFSSKTEVDAAVAALGKVGIVSGAKKTVRASDPPAPFNTTAFLAASAGLGVSPSNAMRIAEGLYMQGLISYPRVDNTVYPESLPMRDILQAIGGSDEVGPLAAEINAQKTLTPTRGKKLATDHPPIHPTAEASKARLTGNDWKIYELVCRRFLATLAPKAKLESMRIDIDVSGQPFFVRGSRIQEAGWLKFYPYGKKKDDILPDLKEGDEVELVEHQVEEKQTQPPARFSQGALIQKMEELGLGTKATRHSIIQNLYDRSYMHSDPIVPTELGIAVADSLLKHAAAIATPEMTATLEAEMDEIAEGAKTREDVVDHSRQILGRIMVDLMAKQSEVGAGIREGIQEGKTVGICPTCGGTLRVIRAKKSKKRFVGCSNYPECKQSYPLPQFGDVIPLGTTCGPCGSPQVKIVSKGKRPWELCLDPNCETKEAYRNKAKKS